jgi:hypothetical protein
MNTVLDIVTFNREHASRHIHEPDRAWWIGGITGAGIYVLSMLCVYAW